MMPHQIVISSSFSSTFICYITIKNSLFLKNRIGKDIAENLWSKNDTYF